MKRASCDRAMLVEAMFDGRLGPAELESTERHVAGCASCAELLRELASLQEMLRSSSRPITPLEHRRARLALLRGTVGTPAVKRRPVALLAAALVTLPLAVWASASPHSPFRAWFSSRPPAPLIVPPSASGQPPISSKLSTTTPPVATTARAEGSSAAAIFETTEGVPAPAVEARKGVSARAPRPRVSRDDSRGIGAPAPSSLVASPASEHFAAAVKALSLGDFSAGASMLEGFVATYPRDPRAEDAAYLEAIALQRAGRLPDAKAAARRYLTVYPAGVHRVLAQRIASE